MANVDVVSILSVKPLIQSSFIRPFQLSYEQVGVSKRWDYIQSHDSVAILIRNTTRDVFVFVRQFRPAVYMHDVEKVLKSKHRNFTEEEVCSASAEVPGSAGVTFELCAGIVDKRCSLIEIAQQEVLEECGYKITTDSLETLFSGRANVGISGAEMTVFYTEVTDEMKVSKGGGQESEGEMIEVCELPVKGCLAYFMQPNIVKPIGLLTTLMWFHIYKQQIL